MAIAVFLALVIIGAVLSAINTSLRRIEGELRRHNGLSPDDEPHVHRYRRIPVWKADGTAIDSWWWCTDHEPGRWVRIEDDPDAAGDMAVNVLVEPEPWGHRVG
jgi:hypothetical protein